MPEMEIENPVYCPRCDRPKANMRVLKKHVQEAHPDYDPEWADDE